MRMKNKILTFMLVYLLLSVSCVSAITFTTENWVKMITEYHFSLGNFTGNSTYPNVEEDDIAWINFLIPQTSGTQKLKLSFIPDCIGGGANATENMYINFYCLDGTYEVIDLKPYDCEGTGTYPYEWVTIENVTGQTIIGDLSFLKFWCAVQRNVTNTDRIPTELTVRVDSMGLSTPNEDENIILQRDSITSVAQGISDLVSINIQVWRILFNIFEITVLLLAFIGLPIVLIMIIKWGIDQVKRL